MLVLDWEVEDLEALRDVLVLVRSAYAAGGTPGRVKHITDAWGIAYGTHLIEKVNQAIEEVTR